MRGHWRAGRESIRSCCHQLRIAAHKHRRTYRYPRTCCARSIKSRSHQHSARTGEHQRRTAARIEPQDHQVRCQHRPQPALRICMAPYEIIELRKTSYPEVSLLTQGSRAVIRMTNLLSSCKWHWPVTHHSQRWETMGSRVFRRCDNMKPISRPCLSTAQNKYFQRPPTLTYVSSSRREAAR